MMQQIDQLAYRSSLARTDPKAKLFFTMIPLFVSIGFRSVVASLFLIVVMGYQLIQYHPMVSLKQYLSYLSIPAGFLLIGTVTMIVGFYPPDSNLLVGIPIGESICGISPSSLKQGIRLIASSLGAVSCLCFLSCNTPMNSLFDTLRRTKLPSFLVSLAELIYRYLFLLWEEAQAIHTAQHCRLGYSSFLGSITSMGNLLSSVFLRAYQRCDRIYAALESRGYNGDLSALEESYLSGKVWFLKGILLSLTLLAFAMMEQCLF